jgi:hypothetical protein
MFGRSLAAEVNATLLVPQVTSRGDPEPRAWRRTRPANGRAFPPGAAGGPADFGGRGAGTGAAGAVGSGEGADGVGTWAERTSTGSAGGPSRAIRGSNWSRPALSRS